MTHRNGLATLSAQNAARCCVRPWMSAQDNASPADLVGLGIACAAGGLYFVLVGLGIAPAPGDANASGMIVVAAGLAFVFAGLTCIVRAKVGMSDHQDDVPAAAPPWIKLAYRALAIGAAGALAIIGTWIAIGTGPRMFTIAAPFGEMQTAGEMIGRTVFALGAVVVWIYVIALTVQTVRKFFVRERG
jgi:hypothetical protein